MAWTEQDYQEIVARLMANSIGVNEVPNADKADDVTSLPAFKPSGSNSEASVVNYPLEFLKGEKGEPGIQGEPGSSFRVAGEYATLEALKSAVPDGSAVDGFMAVGTEAPYDYYAWVSSAGGNNPNPSPDGKYLLLSDGTPLLLANEEPILLADSGERVASNGEWVSQGKIGGIDEAPTDGKAYGRKNGNWAEVPEKSDVLTKTNSESFTPTGDYQPATKKYVDDNVTLYFKINNDKFLSYLRTPAYYKDGDAETAITYVFNTIDNFKNFVNNALDYGYALVFINRTTNEKMYIRDYHVYHSSNGNYELSFIFIYSANTDSDAFELVTTRVFMSYNASNGYKFIVNNLVQSDNLTTLTKKTAAEYETIGSKDANTAYCVTD